MFWRNKKFVQTSSNVIIGRSLQALIFQAWRERIGLPHRKRILVLERLKDRNDSQKPQSISERMVISDID